MLAPVRSSGACAGTLHKLWMHRSAFSCRRMFSPSSTAPIQCFSSLRTLNFASLVPDQDVSNVKPTSVNEQVHLVEMSVQHLRALLQSAGADGLPDHTLETILRGTPAIQGPFKNVVGMRLKDWLQSLPDIARIVGSDALGPAGPSGAITP